MHFLQKILVKYAFYFAFDVSLLFKYRQILLSYKHFCRNGDRAEAENIAMVITDGVSNINSRRTIPEAAESRDTGIHIYSIGIGLTDTRELYGIASEPAEENTFAVRDFDELVGLEKRIFSQICEGT